MPAEVEPTPVLSEKARRLLASPLFVGPTDAALSEKQTIFLVLAGLKPVAEAASGHWVADAHGRHTEPDDPAAVAMFLDSLGLAYRLSQDEHATDAMVSLQPSLIEQSAAAANDLVSMGRLFGYPATAVEAFGRDHCLPADEQERVEQDAGLDAGFFVGFRFSTQHWQEELAVLQQWNAVLRAYGLV